MFRDTSLTVQVDSLFSPLFPLLSSLSSLFLPVLFLCWRIWWISKAYRCQRGLILRFNFFLCNQLLVSVACTTIVLAVVSACWCLLETFFLGQVPCFSIYIHSIYTYIHTHIYIYISIYIYIYIFLFLCRFIYFQNIVWKHICWDYCLLVSCSNLFKKQKKLIS